MRIATPGPRPTQTKKSEPMTTDTKKNAAFLEGLAEYTQQLEKQAPAWLKKIRRENWERFTRLGVPAVSDEEWKYTNITPLTRHRFNLTAAPAKVDEAQLNRLLNKNEINLVFINGVFCEKYSTQKKSLSGLTVLTLSEALQKNAQDIESIVNKFSGHTPTSFTALNNAISTEGVFIKLDKKTVLSELIHIVHLTTSEAMVTPRTFISLAESSEATVLESHLGFEENTVYFSNALTDIVISPNAVLNYCKAQSESRQAFHIGATRVWQERDSNFIGFSLTTGGAITRNNMDVILDGEGINSTLNGLYSVAGQQHVDNHTVVDHRVPNCVSNQLYKGILNGSARAVFNGKIFVQPIAQKTNSYQLNKNLLLGKDCRVDTKPQLEIGADDVKCTHGATIGQLNEDEIFYLQTRCIGRKDAIRMLSHGFVDDIINKIASSSIRQKLNVLLEPTFAALD